MPRYSGATWQTGFNVNQHYSAGNDGRLAVCLHIAEGGYESSIKYLRSVGLSSHFITSERGDIAQMVDTLDSAWAQGLSYEAGHWYSPSPRHKPVNPTWQRLKPGMNTNRNIISIENAGLHNQPRPAAQMGAVYALLTWLGSIYPQLLPYVPGYTLIGHYMLDTIDRVNCPGEYFDLAAIAARVNGPVYQTGLYEHPGVPVYAAATRKGKIVDYLPSGSTFDIDAVTGGPGAASDYAPNTGHLASGAGFIDLTQVRRKI